MKLLVIGHSVFDIISVGNEIIKSAGGIYYSVSALNRIKTELDSISLCSQYDEETYEYFKSEFEKIDKTYLDKVNKIPLVHLNLAKGSERHERYENITDTLQLNIRDINSFDGILINMITGFDIRLNQLREIRKNFSGIIFIDIHTLSRGLGRDYKREFRLIPDFNEWAKNLDIIQVNQNELLTLSNKERELEIVNEIFNYDVKIVCVTKGELGASVYYRTNTGIMHFFKQAKKVNNQKAIGCGDVFGAVFFYNYILNKNVELSLKKAVKAAGLMLQGKFF